MYTIQRVISLLIKGRKEHLDEAEEQELAAWREAEVRHEQLYQKLTTPNADQEAVRQMQAMDVESSLIQLKQQRDSKKALIRRRITLTRITVAAAMLVVGGLLSILYFVQMNAGGAGQGSTEVADAQIVPGSNRATLTLQDGSTVFLDAVGEGAVAEQAGIRVVKTAAGEVQYEIVGESVLAEGPEQLGEHVIATPAGGQYQIKLPDGSVVWLNASSSLSYPVRFAGSERRVKLAGEGYFEVVQARTADQDLKPFIIELPEQTIEVLGTTLNVKSYRDEVLSKTTLITGSVRVSNDSRTVILRPGQQAQINRDNYSMGVHDVHTDDIISWKNGYFAFQNERINTIMNEIARWYDIEVQYQTPIRATTFEGSISKFSELSEVLEILELTGGCTFKIEGRRVMVIQ